MSRRDKTCQKTRHVSVPAGDATRGNVKHSCLGDPVKDLGATVGSCFVLSTLWDLVRVVFVVLVMGSEFKRLKDNCT